MKSEFITFEIEISMHYLHEIFPALTRESFTQGLTPEIPLFGILCMKNHDREYKSLIFSQRSYKIVVSEIILVQINEGHRIHK